jgi:hypothetical protein
MTTTAAKTYEEIIAAEKAAHAEYEATTIGAKIGDHGVTIAELRITFEAVENKGNWKLPWSASVPYQIVSLVIEAVKFFHGDVPVLHSVEPLTGNVLMSGKGYQC